MKTTTRKITTLVLIIAILVIALNVLTLVACSKDTAAVVDPAGTVQGSGEGAGAGEGASEGGATDTFKATAEQEYFYNDYNSQSNADTTRQGVDTFENKDIVFDAVTYEELIYLLQQEGNYLILLGGSWCHNTRAAATYINEFAHQYGITKIYNFDFFLDGTNSSTHVRVTNPADPTATKNAGQEYNHLYGELVSRYLTNLNDWVEYKEGSASSLTYTNADGQNVNVAKVQVPFLFLYNKDNTVRSTYNLETKTVEAAQATDGVKYPIVTGFEEMVDRDAQGVYTSTYKFENGKFVIDQKNYITDAYKARLQRVFEYIKTNNITLSTYSDADYIRQAYNEKSGREIFAQDKKINYEVLNYKQFDWLLQQEGDYIILFAGSWCGNTQAIIDIVNDYAVAHNVTVYTFDTKLDGGYARKYWTTNTSANRYADAHIRENNKTLTPLYASIISNYLTNIVTLNDLQDPAVKISYTVNERTISVNRLQVPFFFSYNKDNKSGDEEAPIIKSLEIMLYYGRSTEEQFADYTAKTAEVFESINK